MAKKVSKISFPRERAHMEALGKWCQDDDIGALKVWEEILDAYPNDILALRLAHHTHFYSGDAHAMCRSIENVMPNWTPDMPGYGFVLGMRAFSHEENFNFDFAEEQGRKAVEHNPNDPWSIHAVLHVMEMKDLHDSGLQWATSLKDHWDDANNFRYHLWWHQALLLIDKFETEKAINLYDEKIWDPESDEYLDFCNDVSILTRLEICGLNVEKRWEVLASKIEKRSDEHVRTFADAHFILALGAVENWRAAESLIGSFSQKGGKIRMEVGVPLCRALIDYKKGHYHKAFEGLTRLKRQIVLIGGSNAQRDVFCQIHIDSAIKSQQFSSARALLQERLEKSPNNNLTKKRLSELSMVRSDLV